VEAHNENPGSLPGCAEGDAMRPLRAFVLRLAGVFTAWKRESDLAEELESHLQMQIDEKVRSGMDAAEARRQSLIESGGIEQAKELYRRRLALPWIEIVISDLRHAVRSFASSPVFAATAIVSIALGIGANAAIFTLLHATLWKPLPVVRPHELFHAIRSDGEGQTRSFSWPLYEELRDATAPDGTLFARSSGGSNQFSIGGAEPERVIGEAVSGDYFSALEIKAAVGRLIDRSDDDALQPVLVLSYPFWLRRFHGDASVLGKIVQFREVPYRVIGVAEAGFVGIDAGIATDVWAPTKVVDSDMVADGIHSSWLSIMMRTTNVAAAQGVIEGRFQRHVREELLPDASGQRWIQSLKSQHIRLRPAASGLASQGLVYERALYILMAMVCVVLLISCANVASLLLARNASRKQEIAVRIALGAGYARLASQLLSESLVLAIAGTVSGLGVGFAGCRLLLRLLPPSRVPLDFGLRPDLTVVSAAALAAVTTALFCGIGPLWQAWKSGRGGLRHDGFRVTERNTGLKLLVAGQLALSVVLLSGAGLFLRVLYGLAATDLGFRPEHTMAFEIYFPRAASKEHRAQVSSEVWRRLSGRLGFSAAYTSPGIYENGGWSRTLQMIEGRRLSDSIDQDVQLFSVSPGFFETLGIQLVEGRALDARDSRLSAPVVVVNETFARKYFSGTSAIGHFVEGVTSPKTASQIVGVVRDVRHMGVKSRVWPAVYIAALQREGLEGTLLVRAGISAGALASVVRDELRQADASAQIQYSSTLETAVNAMISRERLLAYLSAMFGALAILLAAVGLYGVMAYAMSRRTNEIGVRMALGARPRDIQWQALSETLRLIGAGVIGGTALAFAASRLAHGILESVSSIDPWVLVTGILTMASVALIAGWVPARRAGRIDPNVALRQD